VNDELIIEVKGLWKRYGLPPLLPWSKREPADHEWALRDISFSVPRGGSLGILGRNGAGKSTLLKLLAGVTPPDKGSIAVRGSIFPMIELTAGMSMELSGRENIRILGTIMGLSNREIEDIIPEVEEFSELGDWIYRPVWQYSSGMVGRLAFGTAVYIRADILLVDEALSTGDILFQKKCMNTIYTLLDKGTSLVFVSHSPAAVTRICKYGIVLKFGCITFFGDSISALDEYYTEIGMAGATQNNILPEEERQGTGDLRITRINILDAEGNVIEAPYCGNPVIFRLEYNAKTVIRNYSIALVIKNLRDEILIFVNTLKSNMPNLRPGQGAILCRLNSLPLLERGLSLTVKVKGDIVFDILENALYFDMQISKGMVSFDERTGIVYCQSEWRIA
jgi:ABC-type polysaccharide/polyol phosphate transport system ATPase subunit